MPVLRCGRQPQIQIALVKSSIEHQFLIAKNELRDAAAACDTSLFWAKWCSCTTKGYVSASQVLHKTLNSDDTLKGDALTAQKTQHFGVPVFLNKSIYPKQTVDQGTIITPSTSITLFAITSQIRRLQNYIGMLKKDLNRHLDCQPTGT